MEEQKLIKRKKKAMCDDNRQLLLNTSIDLAEYYFKKCNYISAIAEFKIVAKEYKNKKDLIGYARSNRMVGEAYTHLRQYSNALKHQTIHLDIAIQEKNKLEQQRALATIGHTYLTKYEDTSDIDSLQLANESFKKSLAVCEKLKTVSQQEHMDMTARLFANLGLVEEHFGNYQSGIQLVQKSIDICKAYDIFEQLERDYRALGSIYNKIGDYKNAIHQYNLAIEVASRLEDKATLTSAILLAKGEIFVKLFDYHNAKDTLLKAYKLRKKILVDVEDIEETLKIVAVMCYTEDRLLTLCDGDYKTKRELYEKMGDGACELKIFSKAVEYYEKMLQAAIDNNDGTESMGICYFSLAQTYFDNKQYDKALMFFEKYYEICSNNIKESTSTLLSIAKIMDLIGKNIQDIERIYEKGILCCKEANDSQLLRKIISRYLSFLKKYDLKCHNKNLHEELNTVACASSDSESDATDVQTTSNIGAEINVDDITDVSDDELLESTTNRKRSRAVVMKKNYKGETQLHTACITGNYILAQQLLERGHKVNVRDNCGWLPLHEACNHGHLDIVKLLVENGATINDRGGINCEGITPLHDAAVNGHLDIVEYLIDKGGSVVAKNDIGKTPFHCLQEWRDKIENLNPITQTHYESLSKRMMDALKRSGHDRDIVLLDDVNNALISTNSRITSPFNKRKKNVSYSLSSSDEEMEIDKASSDLIVSDTSIRKSNATEQYQEVMTGLRYRRSCFKPKSKSLEGSSNAPALLESGELGDHWLDDDIGRTKKRKTINNPFTSTLGTKNMNPAHTSTNEIARARFNECIKLNNESVRNLKENHEPTRQKIKKKKRQMSLITAGFSAERSPSPLSCNYTTSRHSLDLKRQQTKMTNFCADERIAEADSTTQCHRRVSDSCITNVVMANNVDSIVLSIDVRINGKLYKVPVPYALKNTLTIKWLADEAAKRFCRKEYMKPILELETKNGAVLADDDCVSLLFPLGTQSEEVNATVVKWNVPPLTERYRDACSGMNIDENPTLGQQLLETSAVLDLSNCNFGIKTMKPFCKAINRQVNLHHLDLSGNFILNECLELLSSSLPSLENLVTLNLSMNLISSDGLQYVANIFSDQPEKPLLENLVNLDLSYNPLGNESLKYLAIITRHLKLRTLKLVDVDFTSDIFDDFTNRNIELYLDYVEELNISENQMDKDDILKFILWIRPTNLETLNVSNNIITESGLVVETVRIMEANAPTFWKFKYLNFSRCKVTDAEVYELLRLLTKVEHSLTLNLSYNENLTSISLRRLLQDDLSIKSLYLEGCLQLLQYFEGAGENAWKLNENSNIRNLRLSIDTQKNKLAYNILTNMWKNKYQECCRIASVTENFLELSLG